MDMACSRKPRRSQAADGKQEPNTPVILPRRVHLPFPCRKNHFGVDFAMPLGEEINYEGGAARIGRGMGRKPAQYIGGWRQRTPGRTVSDIRADYDRAMSQWKGR